jgi:uncharacterized protein (TIGR03435 family)
MIPAIKGMMFALSSSLAASIVAKVTVIIVLALFAAWLARGSRAAVRHALLAAAFGVTLLLPIASVVVPPVRLGVQVVVENRASAVPPLISGVEQIPPVPMTDDLGDGAIPVPQSSRMSLSKTISWSNLLLAGWIAGGMIFLLPLVIGLWQIHLLRRSGLPWRYGQSLAETIALDAGVRRRVEVLLHETAPGPMTCGIVHPTIVLPWDAESWNEEDLNRAFVHELEHVRRGDSVSRCLARGACAVYWFHPLVWIARRRLVLEAERACDDAVLRRSEATAYADQLVGLAKRLSAAQRSPLLAMANRADLATRVRAVLDARQRRGRAGAFSLGLATISAMALVISMSSLMLVATPLPLPIPPLNSPKPPVLIAQVRPAAPIAAPATPPSATAPVAHVQFEVASIRPSDPSTNGYCINARFTMDAGRIDIRCVSLQQLMEYAFRLPQKQVDGPNWLSHHRGPQFDILAKLPQGATRDQIPGMLRALLVDRFKLVYHLEHREQNVDVLVVGKGGLKLEEVSPPAPASPADPDAPASMQTVNGILTRVNPSTGGGRGESDGYVHTQSPDTIHWDFSSTTLEGLAAQLAENFQRPVVNMTGVEGRYHVVLDVKYNYAAVPPPTSIEDIEEQVTDLRNRFNVELRKVGLELEMRKVPVEYVVADRVEQTPTDN